VVSCYVRSNPCRLATVLCYIRRSPCRFPTVVSCFVRRSHCRRDTLLSCYVRRSPCRLATVLACYVRRNPCRLVTVVSYFVGISSEKSVQVYIQTWSAIYGPWPWLYISNDLHTEILSYWTEICEINLFFQSKGIPQE
jgi:hypothetical protein